jgi:D-glycerate 3-kinase
MAPIAPWQRDFLERQRLPDSYLDTARHCFDPLAALLSRRAAPGSTLRVALNGSQGSGKSTLCDYLCAALAARHGRTAIALSLDDFYLTRVERLALAETVHPLCATRGVPGTHDVNLLRATLGALASASEAPVPIPRFDKSRDDRAPDDSWPTITAPVDVVLLEGWCLGAHSEEPAVLAAPLNDLEREEDPQQRWRGYSNAQLRDHYEALYAEFDLWVMLAAPGFEQVLRWRTEQEEKLRQAVAGQGGGLMDAAGLQRFVAHFERYTRQCLRDLPPRADVLLQLDEDRHIIGTRGLEN